MYVVLERFKHSSWRLCLNVIVKAVVYAVQEKLSNNLWSLFLHAIVKVAVYAVLEKLKYSLWRIREILKQCTLSLSVTV